jgi:hypothetical protein
MQKARESRILGFPATLSGKSALNRMRRPYPEQGHQPLAERTPKIPNATCIIPCRFSYFCQYDDRRDRGAWLFTLTHFSLAHAFRGLIRDDELYHAEINDL